MSLRKVTDLGFITVNDSVIAKTLINAADKAEGKLFFANDKGKILTSHQRISIGELLGNFEIYEQDEKYVLSFYTIIKFGASIKEVTEKVLDDLELQMKEMFPEYGGELNLKIVGVISKNIAERDIEVKRNYEASR